MLRKSREGEREKKMAGDWKDGSIIKHVIGYGTLLGMG